MRKRKIITLCLSVCSFVFCAFGLSSCDASTKEPDETHVHAYEQETVSETYLATSATCTAKATYYKSCSCGEVGEETFEDGETLGHTGGTPTCIAQAICTHCEQPYGEKLAHDYSEQWSSDEEKHWRVCQTDECTAKTDEQVHSYTNGSCVCGKNEPVDIRKMTAEQWSNAFALENVTIMQYTLVETQKMLMGELRLVGEDAAVQVDGMTVPMDGAATFLRSSYDFSACYDSATYTDGKYAVALLDVYGDGSYVYENALLRFENGKLLSIESTVSQVVEEYDDDFNVIGTTTETYATLIEFTNYGTTELSHQNGPLTKEEWEAAFDEEQFQNYTLSVGMGSVINTLYHAGDQEKFTTSSVPTAALYYTGNVWYWYGTVLGDFPVEGADPLEWETVSITHYEVSGLSDVDGVYASLTSVMQMRTMIETFKDVYGIATYDEESGEYQLTDGTADTNSIVSIKIENGKLTRISFSYTTEDGEQTFILTFSQYGTTSFNLPFTPSSPCHCKLCQTNAFPSEVAE